jgi:hypothetical protein
MFKDFGKRLQRDIKRCCDERLKRSQRLANTDIAPAPMDVNVISHVMQVWGFTTHHHTTHHTTPRGLRRAPRHLRHPAIERAQTH